jgi:sulfur carrier protein
MRGKSPDIDVWVNGEARSIEEGSTVLALLEEMGLSDQPVAVEVNAQVIRRARHPEHRLTRGDKVEVVTFVGGG